MAGAYSVFPLSGGSISPLFSLLKQHQFGLSIGGQGLLFGARRIAPLASKKPPE